MRLHMWVLCLSAALFVGHSRPLDAIANDFSSSVSSPAEIVEGAGKDWRLIAVELAPGSTNSWPTQPGGEFLYVLEGAGRLEMHGKRAVTLNPGSVSALTSVPHHVLTNTSRTRTLKILVVFFNETSQAHPLLASGLVERSQRSRDTISNAETKTRLERNRSGDIGLVF
ncbi:MAG: Cupin domain [Nitrospira sp.]|nr:Cupin domain [Nitrospira sp.]